MLAGSAFIWRALPPTAEIPIGWNEAGEVTRRTSQAFGLLWVPSLSAVISGILAASATNSEGFARNWKLYRSMWFGLLWVFLVMHAMIVLTSLGVTVPVPSLLIAASGAMVAVVGNYLGKSTPDFPMGTGMTLPKRLRDPDVWARLHRAAAPIVVVTGVATVAAAFIFPRSIAAGVLVGGIALATAIGILRSRGGSRTLGNGVEN
jgi:uncharacterized membrane protein